MIAFRDSISIVVVLCALLFSSHTTSAQTKLPQPDPVFEGEIGETFEDSTPSYPQPIKASEGSPNVLLILLDDVGFGMCSTFGGPVETPNLDKLAKNGLTYNRFHTTALCSPTRAALLAGRNHHSVGTGVIIEMGTGFPGYTGIIPRNCALVSQTLRDNGYATSMFGKWHNTPEGDISPAGPFDRWPTGLGFDYFYGFNQGEAHHFYPTLYRNTVSVSASKTPEEGYHLTEDLTDETIAWIRNTRAANRDKPWFCYFSTGAAHAPHHVPQDWQGKYKGRFDHGWDKQRQLTHAKQIEMGIIPKGTKLTPRPEQLQGWKDVPADAKKVYLKLMENYAEFMAHTDHEIGRLIDSLDASGELDNTLIMYVVGDNGASAEGGLEGTFSELASLLGIQLGLASTLDRIDEIGGPESEPHVPVAWAWAMDSPFSWTKQIASHFGGTRNPLVIHWPAGIKAKGELRDQFHHVIDVVPTILEVCKIPAPSEVNGIKQKPIEGVSMTYTFEHANAPEQRTTQYFEMLGNRAIYHDGWVACSRYGVPWETSGKTVEGLKTSVWELYQIDEDFSQANDLASSQPDKLKELQALFLVEAKKYNVLPLDPRLAERMDPRLRVSGEPPTRWAYYGNSVQLPEPIGPQMFPRACQIVADLEIPDGGAEGVITCAGAFSAGWSLYVADGKPMFHYNVFEIATETIVGDEKLPAGKVQLKAVFSPDGSVEGAGTIQLFVNGKPVGEGELERTLFRHGLEPFEIGRDSITPVDPAYKEKGQFEFTGKIDKVEFNLTSGVSANSIDGRWLAEDIDGRGVVDSAQSTLEFGDVGRATGNSAVNRYSGKVDVDGQSIQFGPLALTRRAGPPALMDQEARFMKALEKAAKFRIADTSLFLLDSDDNVLARFTKMADHE